MTKILVRCLAVVTTAGLLVFTGAYSAVAGTVPVADIEDFFGLPVDRIKDKFVGATVGHAMKITFYGQPNSITGPLYRWLTNENPLDDQAFLSIVVNGGEEYLEAMLTGELVTSGTPFDWEGSAWQGSGKQIDPGGAVTLGIGLVDDGDSMIDSAMLIDSVSSKGVVLDNFGDGTLNKWQVLGDAGVVDESFGIDPWTGDHMAILGVLPEPSTFALATFGLLGLLFYGWRRRR